jgi:TolB-like protein/Tfp pilus assembly protein PilF
MDVLVYLAERPGQVVCREELFRELWAGVAVTDDALTRCVTEIGHALDEDSHNPAFIETVPKRGYRIVAPVVSESDSRPRTGGNGSRWTSWPLLSTICVGLLAITACLFAGLRLSSRYRPPITGRDAIAVLPLVNLTGDPQQEYFADAMTDQIITELVHHGWMVVSRTSVMRYKIAKQSIPQIARDLHVDAVLEGAILRSGSRIRITAQLIDAKTDLHLWSGSFERQFSDVLRLQTDLARAVGSELQSALAPLNNARPRKIREIVPEAYDAYLRGLYFFRQGTFDSAASHLEQSITRDPTDALAHALLYEADAMLSFSRDVAVGDRALNAMRTALKLDESLAQARTNLGDLKFWWDWDWAAGEAEFRRAVELDQYSVQAAVHYSTCLNALGRFEPAMMECKRGLRLDPASQQLNAALLLVFVNAHLWQQQFKQYRTMAELYPDRPDVHTTGGLILSALGEDAEAITALLKADRLTEDQDRIAALERAAHSDGLRGYWRERLRQAEQKARHYRVPPLEFAQLSVRLEDSDSAIRFLEAAYASSRLPTRSVLRDWRG